MTIYYGVGSVGPKELMVSFLTFYDAIFDFFSSKNDVINELLSMKSADFCTLLALKWLKMAIFVPNDAS